MKQMNGKGDTYRPTDKERFDEGYDRVFGFNDERFIHEVEGNSIKVSRVKSDQKIKVDITIDDKW